MSRIFLGPLLHWVIMVIIILLGWVSGAGRSHVSQFNMFLILLIVGTVAVLVLVIRSSPPGKRVTREELRDDS